MKLKRNNKINRNYKWRKLKKQQLKFCLAAVTVTANGTYN